MIAGLGGRVVVAVATTHHLAFTRGVSGAVAVARVRVGTGIARLPGASGARWPEHRVHVAITAPGDLAPAREVAGAVAVARIRVGAGIARLLGASETRGAEHRIHIVITTCWSLADSLAIRGFIVAAVTIAFRRVLAIVALLELAMLHERREFRICVLVATSRMGAISIAAWCIARDAEHVTLLSCGQIDVPVSASLKGTIEIAAR